MLPFLPPFANQNPVQRGNDPPPNLFTSSSSALPNQFGFNNPQMLMPAMGRFNNQNAFLSTLLTQQHMMQGLQYTLMGSLLQQGMMPQLPGRQLNLLGAYFMSLQHGGLLGRPSMYQNLNQMLGFLAYGLLGLQSLIFPPNTHLPVIGSGNSNPVLLRNGSTVVGQRSSSSKGLETQITRRKSQKPNLPGPVQNNKSNNGRQRLQMTDGQTGGKNFSNNSSNNVASNNFKPEFNEQGKMEPSHMSFQKFQSCNSRNAREKERRFAKNNQRGKYQRKERTTTFSASNTPNPRKRPLSVVYSESEIQQWREARRNHFLTRANIEKKLKSESANKEEMHSLAKIRRQQLKEVLAKQAELGVKVAVIPSKYITKPEGQSSKIANPDEALNTNIETPCKFFANKKRGRLPLNKRNAKRLKLKNVTPLLTKPEDQSSKIGNPDEALNTNIETSCKHFTNKKRSRLRLNKRNAKRLKLKNVTPLLTKPEDQSSKIANPDEALNTNIETPCNHFTNKKRSRFRHNKRNAKRLRACLVPIFWVRRGLLLRNFCHGTVWKTTSLQRTMKLGRKRAAG